MPNEDALTGWQRVLGEIGQAAVAPSTSTNGWLEAAVAWEVCASIHSTYAKGKDALFTTRHQRRGKMIKRLVSWFKNRARNKRNELWQDGYEFAQGNLAAGMSEADIEAMYSAFDPNDFDRGMMAALRNRNDDTTPPIQPVRAAPGG